MERKIVVLCFVIIPILLFLWAKEEPAWWLLSFEINIFLAFVMAGLGSIGEKLNKKEKQFLYTIGLYYSLFTLIFLYSLMPIFMIEYKKYRFIILSVGQIILSLSCNLWGLYRLKKKV